MELKFNKYNPKTYNITEIAELKYNVDYWTYDKVFKDKKEAIKAIKQLLEITEDTDEFQTYIIENKNDEIVAFLEISKKEYNILLETMGLFKYLNYKYAYKFSKILFIDKFILSNIKEKDLYVAEISVNPKYQGKGYGTLILKTIIKKAKDKQYNRVILDADFRNKGALKLYQHLGFKISSKKRSKIWNEKGMFNLEYKL